MKIYEIENRDANLETDKINTILDVARKHQGFVTISNIESIYPESLKDQRSLFNVLRKQYRVNVVDDFKSIQDTDKKLKKLGPKERSIFNNYTDPSRNNINNDIVKSLLADALITKDISAENWLTLTGNLSARDANTRSAPWALAKKLGALGINIDESLTIDQKKKAVKPTDAAVKVPNGLTDKQAKAYEKFLNLTASNKKRMIANILEKSFLQANKQNSPVTLSTEETNKLLSNIAMGEGHIGRILGPLGIGMAM